ncbi:hypothetical protein INT45_004620 [Circinella minor]|uniref:Heterokaryon incompatibility domain-containing protein n=1 Tax=Circinella minor TaxID=1195481 RepID=A0A8H7VFD8_9FUNG|nr:hypothetical protein INT45_004620 [Circinella minor]
MTYITYTKMQYSNYKKESSRIWVALDKNQRPYKRSRREAAYKYTQPPKKIPSTLPKPDFMPSFLVRTSDMNLVEGSKVQEGYCTLSYSWNQSCETIKNETAGKSYRIDQGKHKIVYPGKTVRKKPRGRKRIPHKVRFVTFEELIQEICKDFNIKYIWYDQMCINQSSKEEKLREIRQMHKIYSNAYCAVALVPEVEVVGLYKSSHTDQHYTIDDMENRVETSLNG